MRSYSICIAWLLWLMATAGATKSQDEQYDTCQRHSALQELDVELTARNASLRLLAPFGAEVSGLHLMERVRSGDLQYGKGFAKVMEEALARTGVIIFR